MVRVSCLGLGQGQKPLGLYIIMLFGVMVYSYG